MISIIYDITKSFVLPRFQKWCKSYGKLYFQRLIHRFCFKVTMCKHRIESLRFRLYWKLFPIIAFFKGYYKFQERWVKRK